MKTIFAEIARENFKVASDLLQPGRERRTAWEYTHPPRSPFSTSYAASEKKSPGVVRRPIAPAKPPMRFK